MRTCQVCNSSIEHKIKSAKFCGSNCKDLAWQVANWSKVLSIATKYRKSEKGQQKITLNRPKINEQCKAWKLNNLSRKRELDRAYHKRNRDNPEYLAKRRHHEAMRRARKLQATPKWLTKEHLEQIKQIYKECPKTYHVDHIIPLKGENVSGLHVPWNLQCLPGIVNRVKHNKVGYGNSN